MKILELRFKNLNSLYGEWKIDFTDSEYVSNGIFALTGPTGAGKSTILDAICLALYGATPRLGKITKSGNEIMSTQTGECYAEVVFESQAGRFLCHWEQRRARKAVDGKLQDQEHQIVDYDNGKIIESYKSKVTGVIEQKTGMDFDRFTRSILLAQGGFDTFLKADTEQKSKILEQITGTEIYSDISRRVHEYQRNEREKLNILQAETAGIVILEPDQEKAIEDELETKQEEEKSLSETSVQTGRAISWINGINELEKEIKRLSEEAVQLNNVLADFKPERDRLDLANKAASLDGVYATLTSIRGQQLDDGKALDTQEEALPGLKSTAKNQLEYLQAAEQKTSEAKKEKKENGPLIKKVRALDLTLTEQNNAVSQAEANCNTDASTINSAKKEKEVEQEKRISAEGDLENINVYLKEHAGDASLISDLAVIDEQLSTLLTKQNEINLAETKHNNAEGILSDAIDNLEQCVQQYETREEALEQASEHLKNEKTRLSEILEGRLLREFRAEKEMLLRESAFLSKIAELEDHRSKLEDGEPCPLCGAENHPYAEGNIPIPDETENKIEALTNLINKAEDKEAAIKNLEKAEVTARNQLKDSERNKDTASKEKKAVEKALNELKNGLSIIRDSFAHLKESVLAKIKPFGITKIPDDDISSLLESLKNRLDDWNTHIKKKAEFEKQISDIDSVLIHHDAVIKTQNEALLKKQEGLQTLKKEYAEGCDQRKALYGDKNTDEEESRLDAAIIDAESSEDIVRGEHDTMQLKLNTAKTNVDTLKKRIKNRVPELETAESKFVDALAPADFSNEEAFCMARLTFEQRNALLAEANKLDQRQTDLMARQKDREKRLATENAKKVTDKSLEELKPQFEADQATLNQLRHTIAGHQHQLSVNKEAKERVKAKQSVIDAQKKECHRWEKLNGLIGSADGKKFRNFAQGLTFELMVSHANRQLEKMMDHYLLIRDEEKPLELNVVDNYQAGVIRSTRNLSGGESFIVSLTLALGLSKMASRKVRVDSLFLDEGFGTLDEDALETALETLSGLQQEGKLIGVISHVSALKERISTQIAVILESGGRSSLAGPGCTKVIGSSE